MIVAFGLLLLCQLAGEVLGRISGLPVPGPVVGAALLFVLLALREKLARILPREVGDGALENTGRVLLANLSLMFVPAGVGVIQNLDVFAKHGLALTLALVVSTVLALAVTAFTFLFVARALGDTGDDDAGAATS